MNSKHDCLLNAHDRVFDLLCLAGRYATEEAQTL